MSTPAAIPWVQFDEPVVGENHPTLTDVDNRPCKFLVTQSDLAITDSFPGFLVRYLGTATPQGSKIANVGTSFIDTTNQLFYLKMSGNGLNTGWKKIGGNETGNGDPESVVTATVGALYEQQDATTDDNAVWFKASGISSTGWRRLLGFMVRATSGIVVGINADDVNIGANSIIVGNSGNADGAQAIGIGLNVVANANNCIAIGNAASVNAAAVDAICIGRAATAASTGVQKMIAIGAAVTVNEDRQILIGANITGIAGGSGGTIIIGNDPTWTSGGINCVAIGNDLALGSAGNTDVLIGQGSSLAGSSGVAIAGTCTTGGAAAGIVIGGTISGGTVGQSVCIGGAITNNGGNVAVGKTSSVTSTDGVAVGFGAVVSAASGVAIGSGATVDTGDTAAICIGSGATWQDRMISIGSNVALTGVSMMCIGHGQDTKATPASLLFRLTNASGADNAAGNLTFNPGLSTGSATPGSIIFQTGDAGASSSTLQTAVTKFTIASTVITATVQVVVDQGAADTEILLFKSSDVAHGMTTLATTDTYASFIKSRAANGGLIISAFDDASVEGAFVLKGYIGGAAADTTKTTAGRGVFIIDAQLKSGTGSAALGANENMVSFSTAGTTRFILDADGDSHQDVGTAWTNFDTHDDIKLLNQLSAHVTRRDDPLRQSFSRWLGDSKLELEKLKLVSFNEDGHHFVNMSRLTMLHTGAIRQLGERFERIEKALIAANLLPAGV